MSNDNLETQWKEYYPKVFGYFFRRLNEKHEVEDLTSLVMHSFFKAMYVDKRQITNPHAYLWQIARNQLNAYIKQKSKQPIHVSWEDDLEKAELESTSYSDYYKSKVEELMECFRKVISGQELKIVEQVVMCDRTSVDVAEELGLTSGNVRQKLSRSIKKVKQKCSEIWELHHD